MGKNNKLVFFSDVGNYKPTSTEVIDDNHLVRKGLIFAVGHHTDSKSRKHDFPEERILRIVENTNKLLEEGYAIPVLKDHNKTVDAACGHIEAPLEVREITSKDTKVKNLIGKMGVFCDGVVLKGKDVVSKFVSGAVKTVSPGIDIVNNTIRELSLTPVPAITGLTLYSKYVKDNANFAYTFDELEQEGGEIEALQEEYEGLTEKLWMLLTNIMQADEEELVQQQQDPQMLMEQALSDFTDRVYLLVGGGEEEEVQPQMQPNQSPQQRPTMVTPYQQQTRKYNSAPLAAFSMAEMEQQIANFGYMGYRSAIGGAIKQLGNRSKTGQTVAQIGSRFGKKVINLTRGKIGAVKKTLFGGRKAVTSSVLSKRPVNALAKRF